jgi:glycosyltransferase involved in cell wall biosynthesis
VSLAAPQGFLTSHLNGTPGIRIEPIPFRSSRFGSWALGSRHIARLVKNGPRPDLIHANGLSALNLAGPTALRRRIPVFVHFHHHAELGRRTRMLARLWIKVGVDVRISPVSEFAGHVLKIAGLQAQTVPTLPNPVEVPESAVPRQSHRPVRVGFVGSPSPRKGLHLLVEIAIGLVDEDVVWLVYGLEPGSGSPYVDECRRRLELAGLAQRVVWGGKVADPADAYREMDVLLIPSLQESWCRVAMEGMAAGLPVVGTSIPGLSELLGLVHDGPTFAVDKPENGREHIRRLAGDPELRRALGERGRAAIEPFRLQRVGEQLLASYRRTLSGSAASVN